MSSTNAPRREEPARHTIPVTEDMVVSEAASGRADWFRPDTRSRRGVENGSRRIVLAGAAFAAVALAVVAVAVLRDPPAAPPVTAAAPTAMEAPAPIEEPPPPPVVPPAASELPHVDTPAPPAHRPKPRHHVSTPVEAKPAPELAAPKEPAVVALDAAASVKERLSLLADPRNYMKRTQFSVFFQTADDYSAAVARGERHDRKTSCQLLQSMPLAQGRIAYLAARDWHGDTTGVPETGDWERLDERLLDTLPSSLMRQMRGTVDGVHCPE